MTTTTLRRSNPAGTFLLLIVLAILGWLMLASVHAVMNHGQAALTSQDCFNKNGTVMPQKFMDPLTGRILSICHDKQGGWFISIDAQDGANVTTYPRSFAKCLADVIEYAKRIGYTILIPGELP